jgi:hypothetical protein
LVGISERNYQEHAAPAAALLLHHANIGKGAMNLESAPNGGMNFSDHHLTINSWKRRNENSSSTPLEVALELSQWYWLGRQDVHCAIAKGLIITQLTSGLT